MPAGREGGERGEGSEPLRDPPGSLRDPPRCPPAAASPGAGRERGAVGPLPERRGHGDGAARSGSGSREGPGKSRGDAGGRGGIEGTRGGRAGQGRPGSRGGGGCWNGPGSGGPSAGQLVAELPSVRRRCDGSESFWFFFGCF